MIASDDMDSTVLMASLEMALKSRTLESFDISAVLFWYFLYKSLSCVGGFSKGSIITVKDR